MAVLNKNISNSSHFIQNKLNPKKNFLCSDKTSVSIQVFSSSVESVLSDIDLILRLFPSLSVHLEFFRYKHIYPFHSGYLQTGTLTNSEDPDEMTQKYGISSGSAPFTKPWQKLPLTRIT